MRRPELRFVIVAVALAALAIGSWRVWSFYNSDLRGSGAAWGRPNKTSRS